LNKDGIFGEQSVNYPYRNLFGFLAVRSTEGDLTAEIPKAQTFSSGILVNPKEFEGYLRVKGMGLTGSASLSQKVLAGTGDGHEPSETKEY
jgi:hypothetical protein